MSNKGVKTQSRDDWRREHAPHGEPSKVYLEKQTPAGYRLFNLICSCGAKLVDAEAV